MDKPDPFARRQNDEAQAEGQDEEVAQAPEPAAKKAAPRKAAPKKAAVKTASDDDEDETEFHPFTLSLKAHGGFDAPMLVLRAKSLGEMADLLEGDNADELIRLMDNTAKAAKYFSGQFPEAGPKGGGGPRGGGNGGGQRRPYGAGDPPADYPPLPAGWTYRTGVGKNGKPWHAYESPDGKRHFINQRNGEYYIADPR